jgi:hypothetical protein
MTNRVEIPAYTDRWMMGDRYGTLLLIAKRRKNFPAGAAVRADQRGTYVEIATVKLDKSGKTAKFVYEDCRQI